MSSHSHDQLVSKKAGPLLGIMPIPGDKSISHRALIFGSLAIGTTKVSGLLEGADVMSTKDALVALGAGIDRDADGVWHITGVGLHGMISPVTPLDLGNSGTGARLLMGVVAGQNITATFCGDASLSVRPMARITDPLAEMGADITCRDGGLLPVTIAGAANPMALSYRSKVASAQIKSAILLAGLNARGTTTIIEPHASRDHSESMLRHFGASVQQHIDADGAHHVALVGEATLHAADIIVPSDPSSAAFAIVAALITPQSDITLVGIGMNPLRTGLLTTLIEMGSDIVKSNDRIEGGEAVADLRIRHSQLKGITVPPERAASMIDEYPILSVVASFADGITRMHGVKELRVKESDRIEAMATGLRAAGITVEEGPDWWHVHGCGGSVTGGATAATHLDHRIAMSFLILGMGAREGMSIDDGGPVATSFPIFEPLMAALGASIARISE